MDISLVWKAAIALGGLALIMGVLLAIAGNKFRVETDPRLDELLEAVLGTNCGACGYPGCEPACNAVLCGEAGVDVCVAGGSAAIDAIAKVMGVEAKEVERGVALVHCKGGVKESRPKALYQGIASCTAADLIAGGGKGCRYGCLGLGTCRDVCPVNAIVIDDNLRRLVDRERCNGCGLCVEVCPRNLIEIVPRDQQVLVMCRNLDKGAKAKKVCTVSCNACKKCEKACDEGAVTVVDNCAVIDYDRCTQCGKCVEACPSGVMVRVLRAD
ncbi:MAG: RnfABCDGE type electron transport complex subunit B [Candidatus Geothermincolia bacterium]